MAGFKAVLFDFDGTIVDTKQIILKSYNHALSKHGFETIGEESLSRGAGIPIHKRYEQMAPGGDVESLVASHKEFHKKNLHLVKTFEGSEETLGALAENKVKIGLVTGRSRSSTLELLAITGLGKYVSALIAEDDLNEYKPHPLPFTTAAINLDEKTASCLVVGDGRVDIEGGKAAGCKTCRAMYGYGASEATQVKPDYQIFKISEVLPIILP